MEIEKDNLYWLFVMFGLLLVIIIYYKAVFTATFIGSNKETFTTNVTCSDGTTAATFPQCPPGTYVTCTDGTFAATTAQCPPSAAAANAPAPAPAPAPAAASSGGSVGAGGTTPTVPEMPINNRLLYMHLFNRSTTVGHFANNTFGNNPNSICNGSNKWCNSIDTKSFLITNYGSSVSAGGLPLLNNNIIGPSSIDLLGPMNTSKILGSFSVVFYGKFNNITFTNQQPIKWYEAYAETPNVVKLLIVPKANDANNVFVQLLLGDYKTYYNWAIPIDTLKSNGNPSLYALVFDNTTPATPNASFYIGLNANVTSGMTPVNNTIRLGYSPMSINASQTLDMNLFAFAYYTSALSPSEIAAMNTYFMYESTGQTAALNAAISKNIALQTMVNSNNLTLQQLQDQVDKCKADLSKCSLSAAQIEEISNALPKPSRGSWHIKGVGKSDVSDADMKKCDILNIKKMASSVADASGKSINSGILSNVLANNQGIGNIVNVTKGEKPTLRPSAPAGATAPAATPAAASSAASSADITKLQSDITALKQEQDIANKKAADTSFKETYQRLMTDSYNTPTTNEKKTEEEETKQVVPQTVPSSFSSSFWASLGF